MFEQCVLANLFFFSVLWQKPQLSDVQQPIFPLEKRGGERRLEIGVEGRRPRWETNRIRSSIQNGVFNSLGGHN
jgi:hypothetical protein